MIFINYRSVLREAEAASLAIDPSINRVRTPSLRPQSMTKYRPLTGQGLSRRWLCSGHDCTTEWRTER